jgi:hypothetical protein
MYNITQSQFDDITDSDSKISFKHQSGGDPVVGPAAKKSRPHCMNNFFVLLICQRFGPFIHDESP